MLRLVVLAQVNPGTGSVEHLVLPVHGQEYLCLQTTERGSLTAFFSELGKKDMTRSSYVLFCNVGMFSASRT